MKKEKKPTNYWLFQNIYTLYKTFRCNKSNNKVMPTTTAAALKNRTTTTTTATTIGKSKKMMTSDEIKPMLAMESGGNLPVVVEGDSSSKRPRSTSIRMHVSRIIDIIERQRIAKKYLFFYHEKVNDDDDDTTNTDNNNTGKDNSNSIQIITGLKRVIYGTQPAAEIMTIVGIKPPRYLCYMISGSLCDIIQLLIDIILHFIFKLNDPSLCWILSFSISILFRHTTHRYLVFGNYIGGYYSSLIRMYTGYSFSIIVSTIFNYSMTHHNYMNIPHYVAWIITLLWTGIVNYFILKKLWSFGGSTTTTNKNTTTTTTTITKTKNLTSGVDISII